MLSTDEIPMNSSYSSLITDDYCGCHSNDEVMFHIFVTIEVGCVKRGLFEHNVIHENNEYCSYFKQMFDT